MKRVVLLVFVACTTVACRDTAPRQSEPDRGSQAESAVVASIIGAAQEVARLEGGNALRAATNGPMLLDTASFSALDTVPLPGGGRGTTTPVRHSTRADAIRCRPFGGTCGVRDNGLFVQLDSLDVSARDAFSAVVTYTWTDDSHSTRVIGYAQVHLAFRHIAGAWRLVEKRVIDIT
jgi:hypothetical protein